jgi:anti-anti-sigma factor
MLVEIEKRGDICLLRLHGRFATGKDSGYLRGKTEEVKNSNCAKVLADFSEVEYIDSTGIGFLIGIYASVTRNATGQFVLCNLNRRVREVLELTRLANVMPIYANVEAASQALLQSSRSVSAKQAS